MSAPTYTIGMITIDCRDPAKLASFWSEVTGCPVAADYGEFVLINSVPALGFQRVSDPTPGKNRVHLDGRGGERETQVQRLRALGATEHETHSIPGMTWTVMTDPEGNYFCVGSDS